MPTPDPIFVPDGDAFVPGAIGRGPWDPHALHGGAAAALVARAVERHRPDGEQFVSRLTLELMRPVPLAPLSVEVRTVRAGRRVELLEAVLAADDTELALARAIRIRRRALSGLQPVVPPDRALPAPEECPRQVPPHSEELWRPLFIDGVEIRAAAGRFGEVGPAAAWFRLVAPIVAGEEPSPLQRVAAVADFGNGVGAPVPFAAGWLYINPDLTISLHREPEGEWVLLDAGAWAEADGVGLAESALSDRRGRLGRALQTILVDHRERA